MKFLRRLDLTGEHDFGDDEPALGTGALSGFQARGIGQSGGDDAQRQRLDGTRFYGQLGIAVRPVIAAGLEMLSLFDEKADEYVGIALLNRGTSHETAVSSGETRVYAAGAPKVCVRLLGGRIEIRVGGAGNEIQLGPDATGYAGKSVARVDDEVLVGTLSGTAPPGGGPVAFIFTPEGGTPGSAGPTAAITAKVGAGAPKVKA